MALTYTEKGPGLHDAVTAAGHAAWCENGVWRSTDDTAVQSIWDSYTLSRCKDDAKARIDRKAKALRDGAVANVSVGELASWSIKRAEMLARKGSGTAAAPMLTSEAAARGITVAQLLAKVESKAAQFETLEAAIGGAQGKHCDAIDACADFAAVAAYMATTVNTGWPAI